MPSDAAPAKNSTCATGSSGSVASAVRVIVTGDVKTAPPAGLVRLTDGGRFGAAGCTVTTTGPVVAVAPLSSVTLAVSRYCPAGTSAHVAVNGLAAAEPIEVEPAKNSTL